MYFFKIPPVPKPRMTRSDRWNTRKPVADYWLYRDRLRIAAHRQAFEIAGSIDILFLLPMPASWSNDKQRVMRGMPHTQKPDTDNLMKGFCDALLMDDAGVWNQRAGKFWWDFGAIVVRENTNDVYQVNIDRMMDGRHAWVEN